MLLSPAKLVCQGPSKDEAHATVAALPGFRLVQTNAPFWLKEHMNGIWAMTG